MRAYSNKEELQQKIIKGANTLADNVASTLGPRGQNVLLQEKDKAPFITKDGVTVAHFVALEDPFENAGAQILKQAAIETNSTAGDGTTTATVLARAILNESQRYILAGVSPIEIQRGLMSASKQVLESLNDMAKPVQSVDDIRHIANISANNDSTIGDIIAMAVDKVGQDGSISIEESRTMETSLDITEGFKINAGYCAGAFITDERRATMYHDNPLILVTDYKISQVEEIMPILEMIARESRPLIIVAEEVEGQALSALIVNTVRGSLKVSAINAPYYGDERRNAMSDLAVSVGATFITRESGLKLQEVKMANLGTAKSVESTKYNTTFVGGNADYERIEVLIEQFKSSIKQTDDMHECEQLQGRIVRLSSGVAVIRVGGTTAVEMTERKHRIEDALEAVRSAQEGGIVGGGGATLYRASRLLDPDESVSNKILRASCSAPISQMARNAGQPEQIIMRDIEGSMPGMGWDFKNNRMVNLIEAGIIDPVKVTRTALQNAVSCAGTLITTKYGIVQTGE
ncbi:MAG TPA: molecular chaperone GroEL [Balneola sp.]|jgi:chaperonin GroEL|nr:molecular chaperone GroEL [Balneola sp.]